MEPNPMLVPLDLLALNAAAQGDLQVRQKWLNPLAFACQVLEAQVQQLLDENQPF